MLCCNIIKKIIRTKWINYFTLFLNTLYNLHSIHYIWLLIRVLKLINRWLKQGILWNNDCTASRFDNYHEIYIKRIYLHTIYKNNELIKINIKCDKFSNCYHRKKKQIKHMCKQIFYIERRIDY